MVALYHRCDGEYLLIIFKRGYIPDWAGSRTGHPSSRYASVSGMSPDQIMYATQASECLLVVDRSKGVRVKAEILPVNFSSYYNEMLVEFVAPQVLLLEKHFNVGHNGCEMKLMVKFEVKHLYFDMLHRSLRLLLDELIARVIPSSSDTFTGGSCGVPDSIIYDFMALDKTSQMPALGLVINSKPRAPVLVTGAFGTGKTRLLAVATHFFIEEGKLKKIPARVLLCAHHQATADAMLDYLGKMLWHKKHPWQACVVRLTRANYPEREKSKYKSLFLSIADFKGLFTGQIVKQRYVVIVTTCLTALNASTFIGSNYFTHVLLDEAGQVREPEAIAPLCMANRNTKIVIAGDDCQVQLLQLHTCINMYFLKNAQFLLCSLYFIGWARNSCAGRGTPSAWSSHFSHHSSTKTLQAIQLSRGKTQHQLSLQRGNRQTSALALVH